MSQDLLDVMSQPAKDLILECTPICNDMKDRQPEAQENAQQYIKINALTSENQELKDHIQALEKDLESMRNETRFLLQQVMDLKKEL